MNYKQLVGYAIAAIGLLLIAYGVYSKVYVASAKTEIHQMAQSKNPILQSIGKDSEKKIGRYGTKSIVCYIGGSLFVLVGAYVVLVYRKRNKKK